MSVIVETDYPRLEPTSDQDIWRAPPVTAGTHDGEPNALLQIDLFNLYFRLRYASGGFGLGYGALLSAVFSAPMSEIVTRPPLDCAYPYMLRPPETCSTRYSAHSGRKPARKRF